MQYARKKVVPIRHVEIFTDGACSGNPGPGGWAAILRTRSKDSETPVEKVLSGGESRTTNNRMELTAFLEALKQLNMPCDIDFYSDSQYLIDSLQRGWARKWQAKGWTKANGEPALNPDLFEQILEEVSKHRVRYHWVEGHAGHPENERCDKLAVAESQKYGARKRKRHKKHNLVLETLLPEQTQANPSADKTNESKRTVPSFDASAANSPPNEPGRPKRQGNASGQGSGAPQKPAPHKVPQRVSAPAVPAKDDYRQINAKTIATLIRAHRESDEQKFYIYAEFIAQVYEQQGDSKGAHVIRSSIDGSYVAGIAGMQNNQKVVQQQRRKKQQQQQQNQRRKKKR